MFTFFNSDEPEPTFHSIPEPTTPILSTLSTQDIPTSQSAPKDCKRTAYGVRRCQPYYGDYCRNVLMKEGRILISRNCSETVQESELTIKKFISSVKNITTILGNASCMKIAKE